MIVPETQHFMATRMKARVRSHQVDHTPLVTAPGPSSSILFATPCVMVRAHRKHRCGEDGPRCPQLCLNRTGMRHSATFPRT